MSRLSYDIECDRCGKLLAIDRGSHLEIMNGKKAVRIYEAKAVAIDCSRCSATTDLPAGHQKEVRERVRP